MRYYLCGLACLIHFAALAQPAPLYRGNDSTFHYIGALEEIVVKAEKRAMSPMEIPMAVTAVTPLQIPGENAPDLRNISGIVPNFYMQEGGLKLSTPIYMRGVGTVSGTPPVGLYVDGVPVFDKNAFIFELYDVRQIDVLRGPQTTLYGRNSINGLIQVETAPPAPTFGGRVQAGIASFLAQNYNGVFHLPCGKVLSKIAGSYNRSKGYFRNRFDDDRKSNPTEMWNVQYAGNWYAGRDWKAGIGVNYNHSYDGGYAYYRVDSLRIDRYRVNYNVPSSYKRDLLSSHVNLKKQWRAARLSSITSYAWTKDKQLLDADFTYLDVFDNIKKSHQHLLTEEINVQSTGSGRLEWTGGVFGFYKDLTNEYVANFGKDRQLLLPVPLQKANYRNENDTWGIAAYGQICIKGWVPGLNVTAGLRYDYEKTSLDYRDSVLFDGAGSFRAFHDSKDDADFQAWLPKFSVLYRWNGQLSTYATVAKGYKAGGYNIIVNDMMSQEVDLRYNEEKLWNYELGVKYAAPSHRFTLNGAVFFIDWKDQQIFVMGMMGPNIQNAGDAHSFGGEADLRWEVLPNLTYTLAGGYNRSRYYRNDNPEHEGNRIVMSPEFTCHTGLHYGKAVTLSLFRNFNVATTVTGFGKQYFDEANTLYQKPYFLWNLDAGVSGKRLEVRAWVKNLLDKAFFAYMLNNPVGSKLPEYNEMGQSGAPRRMGISVTVKI